MKSVGEVMAIGRTFRESFAKAMRSRELDADARAAGRHRGAARAPRDPSLRPLRPAAGGLPPRGRDRGGRRADHDRPLVPSRAAGAGARGRRHRGPRPHLPVGGHLRRRVRGAHALLLLRPRAPARRARSRPEVSRRTAGRRGPAGGSRLGRDPRLRAEPDRAGDRVRLLLRARGDDRARVRAATR